MGPVQPEASPLFPDEERYVAEVEKVIYNVGLANQIGKSICYHTHLEGHKEHPGVEHTCCEVVGSYLYATLTGLHLLDRPGRPLRQPV